MNFLTQLGVWHGTDKVDLYHSYRGISYLDVYHHYFEPARGMIHNLLEIGVLHGASLRMWRDYFPGTKIYGLDIDPVRAFTEENIHVHTGDQDNPEDLAKVAPGAEFDVVIDDGSHLIEHQITSFHNLWPRVKPGGFYCVEDMGQSYLDVSGCRSIWPGQEHNPPGAHFANDRAKLNQFFENLIHRMDHREGDCLFVHFWPQQVILKKAPHDPAPAS